MFILSLLLLNLSGAPKKPIIIEGIVAIAGNKIILVSDLKLKMAPALIKICKIPDAANRKHALNIVWKQAMETEIGQTLLEIEGKKHNIFIDSNRLNYAVQMIIKQNRVSSLAQWKQKLKSENYPYLLWRKDVKRFLLQKSLMANIIKNRVSVDDEAVKSYYLQKLREVNAEAKVSLQEIFIPSKLFNKTVLAGIQKEIKDKITFSQLVLKYSKTKSKIRSGLRKNITPGTYPPSINKLLFPKTGKMLKENTIIGPVSTENGVYFIKILSSQESGYLSFNEVKNKLKKELINKKFKKKSVEWLKSLKSKYSITTHINTPPYNLFCK
jgi:peptidyl-prolyl cis-trans isomerase SurA